MTKHSRLGVATVASCLLLSACANQIPAYRRNQDLIPDSQSAIGLGQARPDTIFLVGQSKDRVLNQQLQVNANNVSLIRILNSAAPNMQVVAEDSNVDLSKSISVQVKDGTLGQLLSQLTANANYAFSVQNRTIHVSSEETKTWNLAAFSTHQTNSGEVGDSSSGGGSDSGDSGGSNSGVGDSDDSSSGGITSNDSGDSGSGSDSDSDSSSESNGGVHTSVSMTEGQWQAVVDTARGILGITDSSGGSGGGRNSGSGSNGDQGGSGGGLSSAVAFNQNHTAGVVAIRSMGLIRATGQPRRMQELDKWLTHLQGISTQQFHLDVKTMEVTLNNNQSRGINWEKLIHGAVDGMVSFAGPVSTTDYPSTAGGLTGSLQNSHFSATLKFLSQFGQVNLVNEPNLTVTNGRTANITTGQEFSYVATVKTTVVEGGTAVSSPQLERILVGVRLAVTPRRLDDGRILMTVVPVITNLEGFTQISAAQSEFRTPNIRLQSLATQVITRPGVPIHIGGLISSEIRDTLNTVPIQQRLLDHNPLKYLFTSADKHMQRRELVIMITPTMVDP